MSENDKGYLWARAALVFFVLTLCLALFTFAPWIECTNAFPGNAQELANLGVLALDEEGEVILRNDGFAVCREAYPLSSQSGPLVLSMLFGVLALVSWLLGRSDMTPELEPEPEFVQNRTKLPLIIEEPKKEAPREIELDVGIDLGLGRGEKHRDDEGDSLMDQVSTQRISLMEDERRKSVGGTTPDGFFVPRGYEEAPSFYVDASSLMASDGEEMLDERLDAPDMPFKTIGGAIDAARALAESGQLVQIRVVPGIYQECVKIPSRVAVVNHRMPAGWGASEYVPWLKDQIDLDHPERVTVLAPALYESTIEFEMGGAEQGLYGIHCAAREGVAQRGIAAKRSLGSRVVACSFEGYTGCAARMEFCGREERDMRVVIAGCVFKGNRGVEGGALSLHDGAFDVLECYFVQNRGRNGGAIHGVRLKVPMMVEGCEFRENSAQTQDVLDILPQDVLPKDWKEMEGLGGSVYVFEGVCKMRECLFVGGGASNGGGFVANVGSKVIIEGGAEDMTQMRDARSRSGGALFAVGWTGVPSVTKIVRAHVRKNEAVARGGAVSAVGPSRLQIDRCTIELNACTGEGGRGGGLYVSPKSEAVLVETLFKSNEALEHGGAVAVTDGSLSMRGQTVLQDNVATEGAAGGVFFEVEPGATTEGKAGKARVLKLEDVEIVGNISGQGASALFVGSTAVGGTAPIRVNNAGGVEMRANRFSGRDRVNNSVLFVSGGKAHHTGEELPDGITTLV